MFINDTNVYRKVRVAYVKRRPLCIESFAIVTST